MLLQYLLLFVLWPWSFLEEWQGQIEGSSDLPYVIKPQATSLLLLQVPFIRCKFKYEVWKNKHYYLCFHPTSFVWIVWMKYITNYDVSSYHNYMMTVTIIDCIQYSRLLMMDSQHTDTILAVLYGVCGNSALALVHGNWQWVESKCQNIINFPSLPFQM